MIGELFIATGFVTFASSSFGFDNWFTVLLLLVYPFARSCSLRFLLACLDGETANDSDPLSSFFCAKPTFVFVVVVTACLSSFGSTLVSGVFVLTRPLFIS